MSAINYPQYRQDGNWYYKIIDEQHLQKAGLCPGFIQAGEENTFTGDYLEFDEISAHEFNHATAQAIQLINEKIFN